MKIPKFGSASLIAAWVIFVLWLVLSFTYGNNKRQLIASDAVNYWAYLPATFIEGDPSFSFLHATNLNEYNFHYLPEYTSDGKPVMKMTMGLAILLLPFFLLAHLFAPLFNEPRDGFSQIYQFFTGIIGMGCYLLLGLWHLRKVLLFFFTEKVSAAVLLVLFVGTNILYYSFGEPLISHVYLFSLQAVIIHLSILFNVKPSYKDAAITGLLIGLSVLTRPTMVVFSVIPFLYGVHSVSSLKSKLNFIRINCRQYLLLIFLCVVVGLPQLLYWKVATGNWLFFSYTQERFFFTKPEVLNMWFSFRKGWLLYSPVMLFSIVGIGYLVRYAKAFIGIFAITLPVIFYILSCWWVWWYGGSLGQRTYIDFYALLAISLGAVFTSINNSVLPKLRKAMWCSVLILSLFSAFKTWQYCKGIIHHDSMNKRVYLETMTSVNFPDNYWSKLHFPNYSRTLRGLPEYTRIEGKMVLIREDIDTRNGPICITDTTSKLPELTNAFGYMRIPHGNKIYAQLKFTYTKPLTDSCCLVMQIMNENGIWIRRSVSLSRFIKNGEFSAVAILAIPFQSFKTEQDLLKVIISNPLHESFCISDMWLCEEVYQ
jgi:hypothetical protein